MKLRFFIAGLLLIFMNMAHGGLASANRVETACVSWDDEGLGRLLANVKEIDKALPNIPPEEARYLEAEMESMMRASKDSDAKSTGSRANKIAAKLLGRHFYPVWELRRSVKKAENALVTITDLNPPNYGGDYIFYGRSEAEKLRRASNSIRPIATLSVGIKDFLNSTEGRTGEYLSQKDYNFFVGATYFLSANLGNYIQCKLAKIVASQTR